MKVKVVTSLNKDLWKKYAEKCIATWNNLTLPEGSSFEIWILGEFPAGLPASINGAPVSYKMTGTQSDSWKHFYYNFSQHPKPDTQPGNEYKFNFMPFSVKVYALAEASWDIREKGGYDYIMWLDADVMITKPVKFEELRALMGNRHLAWLDRGAPWNHGETGFILCSTQGDSLDIFLQQANIYSAGQLFYFAEWHDAFIFTSLVRLETFMKGEEFLVQNLNKDMQSEHRNGLYPFETSPLGQWFVHYKGNLKENV